MTNDRERTNAKESSFMSKLSKTTVFCVGLMSYATLALEILITRVFSVTLSYHYAFMVVSISMLGISANLVAAS